MAAIRKVNELDVDEYMSGLERMSDDMKGLNVSRKDKKVFMRIGDQWYYVPLWVYELYPKDCIRCNLAMNALKLLRSSGSGFAARRALRERIKAKWPKLLEAKEWT